MTIGRKRPMMQIGRTDKASDQLHRLLTHQAYAEKFANEINEHLLFFIGQCSEERSGLPAALGIPNPCLTCSFIGETGDTAGVFIYLIAIVTVAVFAAEAL